MSTRAVRWMLGATVLAALCQQGCSIAMKYTDHPAQALQSDRRHIGQITFSYVIAKDSYGLKQVLGDYKETLKRILEDGARVPPAVQSSEATPNGPYFVRVTYRPSYELSYLDAVDLKTFGSIPGLNVLVLAYLLAAPVPAEFGYKLHYDLYVDGERKQSYTYAFKRTSVAWILLMPFAWVNIFTDNVEEVSRATFYQFLLDATQDGYLPRCCE